MNVGIDVRMRNYSRSGIGGYVTELVRELAASWTGPGRLTVFQSIRDRTVFPRIPGVRVRRLLTPAHHRLDPLFVCAEMARHHLDVLHSPDVVGPISRRFRTILTIPDLYFLRDPSVLDAPSRRYYGQVRSVAPRAAHIIALSECTRADVSALLGVPPERVSVIPLAPRSGFGLDAGAAARSGFGCDVGAIPHSGSGRDTDAAPRSGFGLDAGAAARSGFDSDVGATRLSASGRDADAAPRTGFGLDAGAAPRSGFDNDVGATRLSASRRDADAVPRMGFGSDADAAPRSRSGLDAGAGSDDAVIARLGIAGPFILHVGTIEPRKNLVRLVRAFARMERREGVGSRLALAGAATGLALAGVGPRLAHAGAGSRPTLARVAAGLATAGAAPRLVLAGAAGGDIEAVRQVITSEKLTDRVVLAGFVPDRDLAVLYRRASLFVFPSVYEGFGMPPLEAMACGTPVVAADTPALREVLGDAARFIDPLDEAALAAAMTEVLEDERQRSALVARGAERVTRYSWRRTAELTAAVYRQVGRLE